MENTEDWGKLSTYSAGYNKAIEDVLEHFKGWKNITEEELIEELKKLEKYYSIL